MVQPASWTSSSVRCFDIAARTSSIAPASTTEYLADQLLLPMALAGGGRFRTGPLSQHTITNIAVIERFLDVSIQHVELEDGRVEVVVG